MGRVSRGKGNVAMHQETTRDGFGSIDRQPRGTGVFYLLHAEEAEVATMSAEKTHRR
jgi:hypothetical protein